MLARRPAVDVEERRRFARRPGGRETATVQTLTDVRVLDISASGALLHSARAVDAGSRARLRLNLAGSPFLAEVVIRRVTTAGSGAGYQLGVEFVRVSPEARRRIEAFLAGQ